MKKLEDTERERCADCKWLSRLKHNFAIGEGFEESYCCTLFTGDDIVIETCINSLCESFTERKES